MRVAGTTVSYKLVLPNGYDAAKTYPAILVFGGGPQTMSTIDGALARNFQAEAEQRGYIVIGPAAPDGDLFFYDGDRIFPEFLDNAPRGAQDRRRQVPRRGAVERRHRGDARRGQASAVLSFGDGVSRLPVAADGRRSCTRSRASASISTSARTTSTAGTARWSAKPKFCAPAAASRSTPSRRASRTGSRRSPAPARAGCSTASRRRGKAAGADSLAAALARCALTILARGRGARSHRGERARARPRITLIELTPHLAVNDAAALIEADELRARIEISRSSSRINPSRCPRRSICSASRITSSATT